MSRAVTELVEILRVRGEGPDRFVGVSPAGNVGRIFGGQFLGQAICAAADTVEDDKLPHSVHGTFLRAGDPGDPVHYRVERVRNGRSFATRRVVGSQNGIDRFEATVSCCVVEPGLDFHQPGPAEAQLDRPESLGELVTYGDWLSAGTAQPERHYETRTRSRPIEVRYANPPANPSATPVTEPQRMWYRVTGSCPTTRSSIWPHWLTFPTRR